MDSSKRSVLSENAIKVLQEASNSFGIMASSDSADNYNRIWARDSAVSGLAILACNLEDLYPALKSSIILLQKASSASGQIPSNIAVDAGETISISFGGPVGRTDASFWWIILAILYLKKKEDSVLKDQILIQCQYIFKLANSWEFNQKGLMYVPMSSNWADEYVTHGYVLYDQILRYWALELAGSYYNNPNWVEQSMQVKLSIKQHFLLETKLDNSLYTKAQQEDLLQFDLANNFIASFSPGDRVEKFDAWSLGLLLLLNIPSEATKNKIYYALQKAFTDAHLNGIPAFWPVIKEEDYLYKTLKLNHSYRFKNMPGHFHNGGLWPVVNGFLIAGLKISGKEDLAIQLMEALENQLNKYLLDHPFAEYFDWQEGTPRGISNLCFSASGYLLAQKALDDTTAFRKEILYVLDHEGALYLFIKSKAQAIINQLKLDKGKVAAITIAGESGSGKTTISKAFKEVLEDQGYKVLILHQDNYFKLPPKLNHLARLKDFTHIGPQEVRLSLLDKHIQQVKSGAIRTLFIPYMDWVSDTEKIKQQDVENIDIIIIEGTYTSLLKEADHKIFINTRFQQTRQNRIKRNRETVTDFIEKVLAKESTIINEHQKLADIIIDKDLKITNSI